MESYREKTRNRIGQTENSNYNEQLNSISKELSQSQSKSQYIQMLCSHNQFVQKQLQCTFYSHLFSNALIFNIRIQQGKVPFNFLVFNN